MARIAVLFLIAWTGCATDFERRSAGEYCRRDEQCIEGYVCVLQMCRPASGSHRDAGAALDSGTGSVDAGTEDAGMSTDGGAGETDADTP